MSAPSLPACPALVTGRVAHARRTPLKHRFRYRVYQWLVDLDAMLPRLPRWLRPFSTFKAADHIGDPDVGHPQPTSSGSARPRASTSPATAS